MSDDASVITEDECRTLRADSLQRVGMTESEYATYMVGKCHHKCWRPDGAPVGAWRTIGSLVGFEAVSRA